MALDEAKMEEIWQKLVLLVALLSFLSPTPESPWRRVVYATMCTFAA